MIEEDKQPDRPKSAARRFVGNLVAVLTSDVLNRGTTFLIYILVARQLGTYAFGQMSLALTLFYSFQVVAAFGMQTLITREIAKDLPSAGKYLGSGLLVCLATSVGATLLLGGAVILLDYPTVTRDLILVTALGLVPFAIAMVCEAVIRGWEKMHLIAYVQVPINLLKIAATCVLLWNGGTIFQVMVVIVASRFLIGLLLLIVTWHQLRPWQSSNVNPAFAWSIVNRSTTFVGIDTVSAWWAGLNIVLLSKLCGESEVGLYNAALQLMIPLGIFYQSVMVAAFPIMCRKYNTGKDGLSKVSNHLLELLLVMAIPGTVGLFLLAEPALELVYGKEGFVLAAGVLKITVFILVIKALTFALGHVLLAGSRERTTLRIVTIDLAVGFVLGWTLISNFGLIGAAVAALLTRIVDFAQHYGPVSKLVSQIEIGTVIWKPLLASAGMAGFLLMIGDQNLFVSILSAAIIYFVIYVGIESWHVGGFSNFKARYYALAGGKRSQS